MHQKSLLKKIFAAAILGATMTTLGMPARAGGNTTAEPMELRRIMQEIGENMQAVTDAIAREEWGRVAEHALRIAEHPQPPMAERVRILAFAGSDAGRFKGFDEQTHQAAKAVEQAAKSGDGQAVIASFATLQNSCLSCHQNFRKPFVEHFYNQLDEKHGDEANLQR
jgi:cytochrome c556